ncbi:MAG: TIGR01777 family protein [Chitinophagaceae bacterium]|nr:TIGR01777 family protein [Chitinophagaceae bacterium]
MPTVIITGGTGLVGKALGHALLAKGYHIIILTRTLPSTDHSPQSIKGIQYAKWDIESQTIDENAIASADYIIHLAGAGVADKRWTKKRKQEIVDSRVKSCKLLADSLKTISNKVKAVVSASAIGWYGPDRILPNPTPFAESDPADESFLGSTCRQWEESIEPVTQSGKRLVKLRIGIVLSKDGGALKEFIKPLKFGVAAILGSGKQIISWIHIDDLVRLFIMAMENETWQGTYNAVAPNPVSNKELTLQLAKSRKKFFIPIHVPTFVLKIMLGEMSVEILKSATVSSKKVQKAGFQFSFPTIKDALTNN